MKVHPEAREAVERLEALVFDAGVSITEAAREIGVSRAWAYSLLEEQRTAEAKSEDEAALRLRYEAALELAGRVEREQRVLLLASVIWPGPVLLEASVEKARQVEPRKVWLGRRRCAACGIPYGVGVTDGCARCKDRARSQRRRDAEREQEATL